MGQEATPIPNGKTFYALLSLTYNYTATGHPCGIYG